LMIDGWSRKTAGARFDVELKRLVFGMEVGDNGFFPGEAAVVRRTRARTTGWSVEAILQARVSDRS
jgi:hypothetical protein